MEIWATAQLELIQSSVDQELGNLDLKGDGQQYLYAYDLGERRRFHQRPIIFQKKRLRIAPIHPYEKSDSTRSENEPIHIVQEGELLETLYYGNSEVLNKLKILSSGPTADHLSYLVQLYFFFFKTNKASEQNKLWAGMAKETAHQIGTPFDFPIRLERTV